MCSPSGSPNIRLVRSRKSSARESMAGRSFSTGTAWASRHVMKRSASGPEPGSTSSRARCAASNTDSSTFSGRTP